MHSGKNASRNFCTLFCLIVAAIALCLAFFPAFTPAPAQAADDLYIYSGGGGGGGSGSATSYHGGGGGGGYVGTTDDGAGSGGEGGNMNSGGAGGGGGSSLNGAGSTQTSGGAGGGSDAYAGGAGAIFSGVTGGVGGNGGSVVNPAISETEFTNITFGSGTGGEGGSGTSSGSGGKGGDGGDISLTLNAGTAVAGNITLQAGNGGNGASGFSSVGGNGGNGGSSSLGASGSLAVSGDITLTSGKNGSPGSTNPGQPGTGGGVFFGYADAGSTVSSYTLIFADNNGAGHNIRLTKNNGAAYFNASGLTLASGTSGAVNTVNFNGVSDYDSLSLGTLTLNGNNTVSFDADASGSIDDIYVSGTGNTISNTADLVMQSGKTLNFTLTGLSSANNGETMLNINGGNLAAHAGGTSVGVDATGLQSADFNWGNSVTLADLSSGTFNYTATSGDMTAASNCQLSYVIDFDSANVLQFSVNGLVADASYVDNRTSDMLVESGMFYKNQGTLHFTGDAITVNSGGDFYAGALRLEGATGTSLDFSAATSWNGSTGAGFGDLYLGNLNADGTAGAGVAPIVNGVLGTNYIWSGNLYVSGKNNSISQFNNDLSGKTITFNLANDLTAGDVLLTGSSTILTGAGITMTVAASGGQPGTLNNLKLGDKFTLIAGVDQNTWDGSQSTVTTSGGAIDYTFDLGTEQQSGIWSLTSTLQGETFDDGKAHNALMSASALHLLLSQGGDRVAGLSGKFAPSGPSLNQADSIMYGFFTDMGGGHYEMKTGSHVESNSFHILAGPGLRFGQTNGAKTDLGLFFEAGWGNFDTYNSFYRGDGDTSYYGAGLLTRHDMACGLYGEAALRAGRAKSEYSSGYGTNYDISSAYYGGHLGFGYILPLSELGSFDFSAKLLYTRLKGDTDTNSAGDRMKVNATDSVRTQLGVQYNHKLAENFSAFGRVVWDYEFDGETTGRYNQYAISKTDASGSTVIGEIGLKWQATSNITIDLSGHGLAGQREGYGASLGIIFAF